MTGNWTIPEMKQSEAGLADIVACETEICFIDGKEGRLVYRGYNALELAEKSSFEEVAYLLWYGCLPRVTERRVPGDRLRDHLELRAEIRVGKRHVWQCDIHRFVEERVGVERGGLLRVERLAEQVLVLEREL